MRKASLIRCQVPLRLSLRTYVSPLTWNGTVQTQNGAADSNGFRWLSTSGLSPGDLIQVAQQVSTTVSTTGRYLYSLQVTGTPTTLTVYGAAFVIAEDASPLRSGERGLQSCYSIAFVGDRVGPCALEEKCRSDASELGVRGAARVARVRRRGIDIQENQTAHGLGAHITNRRNETAGQPPLRRSATSASILSDRGRLGKCAVGITCGARPSAEDRWPCFHPGPGRQMSRP